MSLTESIVSQCFGQVPTLSPVAAALPLTKLEHMSKTRRLSQSNCRFLAHPAHFQELRLSDWSGVGLVAAALSPPPPNGVPFWREYPALQMDKLKPNRKVVSSPQSIDRINVIISENWDEIWSIVQQRERAVQAIYRQKLRSVLQKCNDIW